ncbi:hypothetical protein VNO77_00289 [Canavalia gladiata]|uniref:Uncharacterized protein n=1 Tax=Canavalia gladiata TaxID=3824 RepID=A0AAN9MPS0_CANGL
MLCILKHPPKCTYTLGVAVGETTLFQFFFAYLCPFLGPLDRSNLYYFSLNLIVLGMGRELLFLGSDKVKGSKERKGKKECRNLTLHFCLVTLGTLSFFFQAFSLNFNDLGTYMCNKVLGRLNLIFKE